VLIRHVHCSGEEVRSVDGVVYRGQGIVAFVAGFVVGKWKSD
jgi:hypothetical protein